MIEKAKLLRIRVDTKNKMISFEDKIGPVCEPIYLIDEWDEIEFIIDMKREKERKKVKRAECPACWGLGKDIWTKELCGNCEE